MVEHLNLTPQNAERLKFLLGLEDGLDFDYFMDNHWKGEQRQGFAVSAFHREKLSIHGMSKDQFILLCEMNKKVGLRSLFLSPISEYEVEVLGERIASGSVTLSEVYDWHMQEPTTKLLQLLL